MLTVKALHIIFVITWFAVYVVYRLVRSPEVVPDA